MKRKVLLMLFGFIIGIIVSGTCAYAATLYEATEVAYDNTNSGSSSTDVQSAIDELYEKANNMEPEVVINPSYIYLEGVAYEIKKGAFPGTSSDALPLDGYYSIQSNKGAGALGYSVQSGITKNNVQLAFAKLQYRNTDDQALAWGYLSFVSAYGLSINSLSTADTSGVTVNYWLSKVVDE